MFSVVPFYNLCTSLLLTVNFRWKMLLFWSLFSCQPLANNAFLNGWYSAQINILSDLWSLWIFLYESHSLIILELIWNGMALLLDHFSALSPLESSALSYSHLSITFFSIYLCRHISFLFIIVLETNLPNFYDFYLSI